MFSRIPSASFQFRTLAIGLVTTIVGMTVSAVESDVVGGIASALVAAFFASRVIRIRCPKCGHRVLYYESRWVGRLPVRCRHCGLGIRESWRRW